MIRRSTWIVLAIFVVMVAAAVLLQRYDKGDDTATPTPIIQAAQPAIYDLGTEYLTWIKFMDSKGNQVEVERESDADSWVMVGETEETSDSFRINSIAGQLTTMQAMTTFETDLGIETVGLKIPGYLITMRTNTGNEIVTKVGNLTAIGTGYYIQVDEGEVVVVAKLVMDEVLGIIVEPPLAATPTPEITETPNLDVESTSSP